MRSSHSAKIDLQAIGRIVALGRPSWVLAVAVVGAMAGAALLNAYVPLLTGRVIDALQAGAIPWQAIAAYATIAVSAASIDGVAYYLSTRLREYYARNLRERLVEFVYRARYDALSRLTFGELSNRMTSDAASVSSQAQSSVFPLLRDSLTVATTLGAIFFVDARFGLISVVLLLLSAIPTLAVVAPFARLGLAQSAAYDRLYGALHETCTLQAGVLVRNANAAGREAARMGSLAGEVASINVRQALVAGFASVAATGIRLLGPLVILGYGSYLASHHQIGAGSVVALLMYQLRMYAPFSSLSSAQSQLTSVSITAQRLCDIVDLQPEAVGGLEYPLGAALRLRDVSLAYGDKPVLKGLTINFAAGRHTALLGPSGAGKSTIGLLLLGIFEAQSGSVDACGVDIRRIDRRSLRRQIVLVPQDALLFDVSVRDNVAYFRPGATDVEIRAALDVCRMTEVVAGLEMGLDTVVGQRGFRLSGGERQRLCLARAVLAQPEVLILDEALSGVDPENERAILAALRDRMCDRTLIFITHRLASIKGFDQVAVVENGRCTLQGSEENAVRCSAWFGANVATERVAV